MQYKALQSGFVTLAHAREPRVSQGAPRRPEKPARLHPLTRCRVERRRSESNRRIEVLQTSALPLGYGAVRHKLAIYLDFLNPPREVLPTSFKPLSCRTLTLPQSHERPRSLVFSAHSKNTPQPRVGVGIFVGSCRQANAFRQLTSASPRPCTTDPIVDLPADTPESALEPTEHLKWLESEPR